MSAALRFDHVACRRGGRLLFSGIDFALGPGQGTLVEGPNGAGKSSLLRLAAGLLEPFEGTVTREGGVALSDENLALDVDRPLARALAFWVDSTAARGAMTAFGLDHLADVPVRMLSTGQRKRASLARVAASGAAIWLLDEPANGLDMASIDRLGRLMAAHLADGGVVLAASHQPLPAELSFRLKLGERG